MSHESGNPPPPAAPRPLLKRLEGLGADPSRDAGEARRIVLANRLALSYIVLAFPFFLVFPGCGLPMAAWALFPVLAWPVLTLALNARGWILPARANLALGASVPIMAAAVALGRGSGAHHLLPAATANFLILFDWRKERIFALAGLAANSALYLGYQSLDFRSGLLYAPPPETERLLRLAFSSANLLGILAGIYHLMASGARAEAALIEAREKARDAERMKGRIIADMGHEVRTPLNVILGLAQILETPAAAGPKRKEVLADIRSSANELLDVLNPILDLFRLEAGKLSLEPRPFRAADLAEAALSRFRPLASRKGLALTLSLDPGIESLGPMLGDAARVEQILRNLLANAVGFTERGAVALRVRSGGVKSGRRELDFEVIDTGPGIPAEAQEGLFQPFRRADEGGPLPGGDGGPRPEGEGIARPCGGAGVGLALSKGLAERMGGSLALESRPGLGTTVRFSAAFPPAEPDPEEEAARSARRMPAQEAPQGQAANARILIVEDHALNRMVLRNMLAAQGFRADEACRGDEALEAHAAGPYDLIFMDYHMPVMDGIECARRIRARGGPRPIIIGVTADSLAETRESCLAAGMDRIILKPVEMGELRRILAPWAPPGKAPVPGPAASAGGAWVDAARVEMVVKATRMREPAYRHKAWRQFRADAEALRDSLRNAGGSGNAREMKESAHGLKGLCLTMGLNRLADTCKRIELASLESSPDWVPVLAEFEAAFGPSMDELGRLLGERPEGVPAVADRTAGPGFSPPAA